MEELTGERPEVEWKPFVLAQINSKEGPEWKAWEHDDTKVRGMLALKAGLAAMRQGREAYDKFHLALVKARHEQRKELTDINVVLDCAKQAGLDIGRLQKDMKDPKIVQTIAESHDEGVKRYGVFGVPTFVFPNGQSAFLKMFYPDKKDSVEIYESLSKLMSLWVNIGEIKRPQPPWPAGVQART